MKKLIAYLAAFKWRMLGGFCLKTAGTVAELFLPLIMAHMLDDVAPARNVLALSLWGAGMLAVAAAAWARATQRSGSAPISLPKRCLSPPVRRTRKQFHPSFPGCLQIHTMFIIWWA